jgi:ABC-type Mn2+/Zn2+ transport system permease subunit
MNYVRFEPTTSAIGYITSFTSINHCIVRVSYLIGHILFASVFILALSFIESQYMQKEVIEKIAALITAAFGLIAALAWNEAIQEIFRLVFGEQSGVLAMIFYAVVVTIIAVVVTIWIGRVAEKHTGKKIEGT